MKRKSLSSIQSKFETPLSVDRPIKNFRFVNLDDITVQVGHLIEKKPKGKYESAEVLARKFEDILTRVDRPIKNLKYVDLEERAAGEKNERNVK